VLRRCGHLANSSGDAIYVLKGVGKPGAFSVAQILWNRAGHFLEDFPQPFTGGRLTVKRVDVGGENNGKRRDSGKRLHALDQIPPRRLLHEPLKKTKGQLFRYNIGEKESATFWFGDHFDFARDLLFHFRPGEIAREFVPKRDIGGLGQLENLSGKHTLRNEGGFLTESELRRISPFHETRKHLLEQYRAWSQLFVKATLNKTREGIVESVRKGEGSSGATLGLTAARPDMSEKFRRRFGLRCFRKSGSKKFSAVIIRAANEDFFPRLGVSRSEIMAIGELINFCRRQFAQQFGREIAEQ